MEARLGAAIADAMGADTAPTKVEVIDIIDLTIP